MADRSTYLTEYLANCIVFGRFRIILGPFRTVSDRFPTISDGFGSFSDRFRRFRTIFGAFRTVFRPFRIVFGPLTTTLFLILKFLISIGQGWGTAVADRRSDPSGPTAVPRPAPARVGVVGGVGPLPYVSCLL